MQKTNYVLTAVVAGVALGLGFFGGLQYNQNKQFNNFAQFGEVGRISRQFGGRNGNGQFITRSGQNVGFRPISGEIISINTNSISVKLADGSSKLVILSDKTSINKASKASKSDLKTGERVAVFGQSNSDGSFTAQNIQINPIERVIPNNGKSFNPNDQNQNPTQSQQ